MIFDDVWWFFMMFHDFWMIFDDCSWCLIQCLMILDYVWWFSYLFLGWTSRRTSYFASARYQDFTGVGYLKGFIRLNNFVVKVAKNKLCPIHHPFITWEVFYTLSSFHWWTRISTETNPYHQPRSHKSEATSTGHDSAAGQCTRRAATGDLEPKCLEPKTLWSWSPVFLDIFLGVLKLLKLKNRLGTPWFIHKSNGHLVNILVNFCRWGLAIFGL